MAEHATQRFQAEWKRVSDELDDSDDPENLERPKRNSLSRARVRKDWLPADDDDLRPTDLGNTLWAGETMAGRRYGLDLRVALPRMLPLMSPIVIAELSERRNQLDASVRFSVASGAATAVSIGLLLRDGPWLFLALGTYLLCWASYRAAVAAARGFSTALATAVDLYHLQLFDALSLERPAGLMEEIDRNDVLGDFFRGYNQYSPTEAEKRLLRWVTPKGVGAGDAGKPAMTSPGTAGDSAG